MKTEKQHEIEKKEQIMEKWSAGKNEFSILCENKALKF